MGFQQSLKQTKRFIRKNTEQENKIKTSGVVYEVDCNNSSKKYTGESGKKVEWNNKEHKDDGEKFEKIKR